MKQHRHAHPHLDPRQPRDGSRPQTNPPVFAWKPVDGVTSYGLVVARDAGLSDVVLEATGLRNPMYLPFRAFDPGVHYWTWTAKGLEPEVFCFEIPEDAATVIVPPTDTWLGRLGEEHPRLYVSRHELADFRESRNGTRAKAWEDLKSAADQLLSEPHEIEEPPYLPDRTRDYQAFFRAWAPVMWDSRRFVKGAELLAFAWLASGDERYGRAACERMASISRWNPEGSSHISHNDEAHMSVIWNGTKACDWAWDLFTAEERALVIEQFRRRGEITYDHMHSRGCYGVTRFDSHAGREIVFLALLGMVFHEHIPQAVEWLDWLRPVLCGIWPVWAGDDGAWAEGPSYGLAYVSIMTMFATALKQGVGVDLYRRPFWVGHARWREWCWPPYAEWIGFGDHTERWRGNWLSNARLVNLIQLQTGTSEFSHYVHSLRAVADELDTPENRKTPEVSAQEYLLGGPDAPALDTTQDRMLRVFPGAGWAAVRTDLRDPERDVAFIFRSSPFGAISHSHAANNDFILHAGGKVLAMPSGYYDGYGSNHHAHWVWHTKSHNCVTLSDAGQIMRSHSSRGTIANAFEDDRLAYLVGIADESYADRATCCRRHVVFLKEALAFVMIDEFVAVPGIVSALQWNIHSWAEFDVDEDARRFRLEREGSSLEGTFMVHRNSFFSLTEGWDPPPTRDKPSDQWLPQRHLRFTLSGPYERAVLGTVLCPGLPGRDPSPVETALEDGVETAAVGGARIELCGKGPADDQTPALARVTLGGLCYSLTDGGISAAPA